MKKLLNHLCLSFKKQICFTTRILRVTEKTISADLVLSCLPYVNFNKSLCIVLPFHLPKPFQLAVTATFVHVNVHVKIRGFFSISSLENFIYKL